MVAMAPPGSSMLTHLEADRGRSMPSIRLSSERREEILLAQAVDSAINRLRPGLRPDAPDELVGAVNQVLADLDESATTNGAVTHDADALPPIKLPIVLLDGLEVTQEVQDVGHSVPLIAGKATIVRGYLSYASAPVVVRGEILVARSPHGPWRAISSVGPRAARPRAIGLRARQPAYAAREPGLQSQLPASGRPDERGVGVDPVGRDPAQCRHPAAVARRARGARRGIPHRRATAFAPGANVTGVVDAIVPTLDGASSVKLLVEGEVADSHPVGGETAEIGALVQPEQASAGADDEQRGDDLDLRWEAPDAPPPSQRYSIQVSDDGGVTWQTVATGLTEPAVTLQPGDFASNQIDVRVLATTGSRTAVVGTETVSFR